MEAFDLLHPLGRMRPRHTILYKLFDLGLEHRVVQTKVVDRAHTQDARPLEAFSDAEQQGATSRTEVVGHQVASSDSLPLSVLTELVLAADELQVRIDDDEGGGVSGRRDLPAIGAVADEVATFDETGSLERLQEKTCLSCDQSECDNCEGRATQQSRQKDLRRKAERRHSNR